MGYDPWRMCPNCKKLKKESETCPHCGWNPKQIIATAPPTSGEVTEIKYLIEASDTDLKQGILKSVKDLEAQEFGTGWGKFFVGLTGSTSDWMNVKLLKAIIDQNKIIIRQNELMLRALERLNHRDTSS